MGKNPGVTSLILVWRLYFTAKRIISNKIGGGRKDSAVISSRGAGRGAESLASAPGCSLEEGPEWRTGKEWGWGDGRGARRGSGGFQGSQAGVRSRSELAAPRGLSIPGSEADSRAGEQLDYC